MFYWWLVNKMRFHNLQEKNSLNNVILAVGLVMGFTFVVMLSIYLIRELYGSDCSCRESLPIVIATLSSLGVFVGILTYYFLSASFLKEKKQILGDVEKTLNFLAPEEKKILREIIKQEGEATQSLLGGATGLGSVKLHRRLLALESKGILQKEKKGMTKKVILNNEFKELFIK